MWDKLLGALEDAGSVVLYLALRVRYAVRVRLGKGLPIKRA